MTEIEEAKIAATKALVQPTQFKLFNVLEVKGMKVRVSIQNESKI